jgi:release factor glutamine methyltransferase
LKNGEPVDYIIGYVWFLDNKIDLSLKPFIPRPETEYWVKKAIENIKIESKNIRSAIRILDIFSGSGAIGIGILKNIKNAKVDFSDINSNFLKQIKINLEINGIENNRYRLIKSNIFENIKDKYNYIFANPPYIAKRRINKVQKSVLKFEPKNALFGGDDGFLYIREFLKNAKKYLKKEGKIYMEFDSSQIKKIDEIIEKNNYKNYCFFMDQYGKWRYVLIFI